MKKWIIVLIVLSAGISVLFLLIRKDSCFIASYEVVEGKIEIHADTFLDVSRPYHYKIVCEELTIIPTTFFYASFKSGYEKFIFIQSKTTKIVAVAASSEPDRILILHDFSTHESYPYQTLYEDYVDSTARGQKLFQEFCSEYPEVEYKLAE